MSNAIKNEIDNSRPVLMGGEGSFGHAWVVDDYKIDTDGIMKIHCNFGWSRFDLEYFPLHAITPESGENFSYDKEIVLVRGIRPLSVNFTSNNRITEQSNAMVSFSAETIYTGASPIQ